MKVDYVHKDTLTATNYAELNKNNELLMSYNQALLKENKQLKKQLSNSHQMKNQQKEFIDWLENEWNKVQQEIEEETDYNIKYFKIERRQIIIEISSKFKEIIGYDK